MEKRKHQRYEFASGKRPVLKVGDKEFPIENISQGGIRFVKGKDVQFEGLINGVILFPDGESIDIDGNIIWEQEDVIGLSFSDLIPEDILVKEQQVAFLKTKISIPKLKKPDNFNVVTGYTLEDVQNTGISLEQLENWMNMGYILPSAQESRTSGAEKIFSRFDLYAIKLFEYLIQRGFSEKEAAIRTRIMILAEKKPGRYLYKAPFVAFSRKIDFSEISDDMKRKMLIWLTDKEKMEGREKSEVKDLLKKFVPILVQEKEGKLFLSDTIYEGCEDILVVNFKKIRDQVDVTLGDMVIL